MLVKELEKQKAERLKEGNEIIEFSKQLLSSNEAGEREALRELGLDDHLKVAEHKAEMSKLDREFSEKYEGTIFHISEIKRIGMKYRLFLKRSRHYRGIVPADIGSIVHRMKLKHNLNLNVNSDNSDSGKFFILAPPSMFKDYNTVGEKLWKFVADMNSDYKESLERKRAMRADPCMFYQVDDQHFLLIKKWGTDFNFLRKVKGWLTNRSSKLFLLMITMMFFIVQLPFRAWLWADAWVYPQWTKIADPKTQAITNVVNGFEYGLSHTLVFIAGLAVAFIIIRGMFLSLGEDRDRIWRVDRFGTKEFFEQKFKA